MRVVIKGDVQLPASKSISNRVLIIGALSQGVSKISNLSECDDTNVMLDVLESMNGKTSFNVGHAGTAMRFLTSFLAMKDGSWRLSGSERMLQRPIGELVDVLKKLGATIEYDGKDGFPPLSIVGKSNLPGGQISIEASISSQFITSLMLIAPYMSSGLTINLKGKVISESYIMMTKSLMNYFGGDVTITNRTIRINPGAYKQRTYVVESDWTAASYFFEMVAVSEAGSLFLNNISEISVQGDSKQVALWRKLGVKTRCDKNGIWLEKCDDCVDRLEFNFSDMPDLVQSFAVACCVKNIPFKFTGLETLRIKETDRVSALISELSKLGYKLKATDSQTLVWDGDLCDVVKNPEIKTYNDHRMAMSFAAGTIDFQGVTFENPDVVSKSFPKFWDVYNKIVSK